MKSKRGDLADVNYRAIAISTSNLPVRFAENLNMINTNLALRKATLRVCGQPPVYLRKLCRGSYVFTCFIDFTKAFDRINYWKLFCKLLDDELSIRRSVKYCYIGILVFSSACLCTAV